MGRFSEKVEENKELIEDIFSNLHATPELGMEEYKSSKFLKEKMIESGVFDEILEFEETGLIGVIKGEEEGPVVAIRADFDALQFDVNGEKVNKHACGHDAHATMALSSAIIAGNIGIKRGTLKLVLQPGEEVLKGARAVLASGYVSDVDEMYGGHLRPIQEAKLGEAAAGLWHSAFHTIKVKVIGKESHGARPHLGISPIDAGIAIVNGVNAILLNPASNYSAKCTVFKSGNTMNIVSRECELIFDLRAELNEDMAQLKEKVYRAIEFGAKTVGATTEIVYENGCSAAEYDEELRGYVQKAIEEEFGEAIPDIHTPGGEDFHFFSTEGNLRTAYFGLGADLTPGLHSVDMDFNKDALLSGVKIWLNLIENRLG